MSHGKRLSLIVTSVLAASMLTVSGCGGSSPSVVTVTAEPSTSAGEASSPSTSASDAPESTSRLLSNARGICDKMQALELGGVRISQSGGGVPTTYIELYAANNVVQQYLQVMISDPNFGADPVAAEVADLGYQLTEYLTWLGDNSYRYGDYEETQDASVEAMEAAIVYDDGAEPPVSGAELQKETTLVCAKLPS